MMRMDAGGQFIGIELDEAVGKNSGTVKDKQYFVCPPMHGVICRYIFIVKSNIRNDCWMLPMYFV